MRLGQCRQAEQIVDRRVKNGDKRMARHKWKDLLEKKMNEDK